jgi:hypothetical protein
MIMISALRRRLPRTLTTTRAFFSTIDDFVPPQNREVIREKVLLKSKSEVETDRIRDLTELKLRIQDKNLSLAEHLEYLRKPIVQSNPKSTIIVMNSLFKKLVLNEGIPLEDDIHRLQHRQSLKKI